MADAEAGQMGGEKMLTEYRRRLSKEEWQGEAERETEEEKMGQLLARWLGFDTPL